MEASKALTSIDNDLFDNISTPPVNSPKYRNCAESIARDLATGHSVIGTAFKYQLDRKTIQTWMHNGHFLALIEAKKNEIREELLENIKKAGRKEHLWQSNAWILERSPAFKGEYAQPKAQGQGAASINVQINVGSHPAGQEGIRVQIGQEPDHEE